MKRLILIVTMLCAAPSHAGLFTAVTNGYLWQSTNYLNELQTTYRDHVRIVTESYVPVIPLIVEHDIIQHTNIWRKWQDWGSNNATFFVNDQAVLTNVVSIPMLTYTGLLQQIGLTNGLRRVDKDHHWTSTNNWANYGDPMYSYGHMEVGDIHGPWVRVDIQAVYSGLKWTKDNRSAVSTPTLIVIEGEIKTRTDTDAVEATAKAAHELGWTNVTAWTGSTSTPVYVGIGAVTNITPTFSYYGQRRRAKGIVRGIMTNIQHTATVYLHPYKAAGVGVLFSDVDNQGWAGSKKSSFFEDLPIGRNTSRTSSLINFASSEQAPSATIPITPPTTNTFTKSARVDEMTFVYKWAWAHTNK